MNDVMNKRIQLYSFFFDVFLYGNTKSGAQKMRVMEKFNGISLKIYIFIADFLIL